MSNSLVTQLLREQLHLDVRLAWECEHLGATYYEAARMPREAEACRCGARALMSFDARSLRHELAGLE